MMGGKRLRAHLCLKIGCIAWNLAGYFDIIKNYFQSIGYLLLLPVHTSSGRQNTLKIIAHFLRGWLATTPG